MIFHFCETLFYIFSYLCSVKTVESPKTSMKRLINIAVGIPLLFMVSCNSGKSPNDVASSDADSVAVTDSMQPDTLHQPLPDEFEDGHMPPPPGGKRPDGPPPHKDGRPPHKPDNMRGFDPAFEDDMDDNGMSRYMENNDEEGWD